MQLKWEVRRRLTDVFLVLAGLVQKRGCLKTRVKSQRQLILDNGGRFLIFGLYFFDLRSFAVVFLLIFLRECG